MKERITKLMMRAGIGNLSRLLKECERIAPPRIDVKHDLKTVSRNLVSQLANGRVRQLSLEQIDILCRALKCTPNHLFGWEAIPGVGQAMTAQQVESIVKEQQAIRGLLDKIAKSGTGQLADEIRNTLQNL